MQSHIVPVRRSDYPKDNVTVIILAANIGYGMKSYGPKSLLHINNKETLLEYQINSIKSVFPKSDLILVVGYLADKIIKKCPDGVRIIENQFFEESNEAEQIRLALNCALTNNVLIIKDDIVFNSETLNEISKDTSCIIYDTKNQIDANNVGVTVVDNYATIFSYDIPTKWCHIAYLTNKELKIVQHLANNRDRHKMFFFELLNLMLKKTNKIHAIEPKNMEIVKIDASKNLTQL